MFSFGHPPTHTHTHTERERYYNNWPFLALLQKSSQGCLSCLWNRCNCMENWMSFLWSGVAI